MRARLAKAPPSLVAFRKVLRDALLDRSGKSSPPPGVVGITTGGRLGISSDVSFRPNTPNMVLPRFRLLIDCAELLTDCAEDARGEGENGSAGRLRRSTVGMCDVFDRSVGSPISSLLTTRFFAGARDEFAFAICCIITAGDLAVAGDGVGPGVTGDLEFSVPIAFGGSRPVVFSGGNWALSRSVFLNRSPCAPWIRLLPRGLLKVDDGWWSSSSKADLTFAMGSSGLDPFLTRCGGTSVMFDWPVIMALERSSRNPSAAGRKGFPPMGKGGIGPCRGIGVEGVLRVWAGGCSQLSCQPMG